jgi:uracil DNA glycosylase
MVSIVALQSMIWWTCKELAMQWFNLFDPVFSSWNGSMHKKISCTRAFAQDRSLFIHRKHVAEALDAATKLLGCSVIWSPAQTGKTFTICNHFSLASNNSSNVALVRIDWAKYNDPEEVSMEKWMMDTVTIKSNKFTVLFMDHYDSTMGGGRTPASMKFMRTMMQRSIQRKNFTIIVAVNSIINANTMRNWLAEPSCAINNGGQQQAFRLMLLGSEPHQSLMWSLAGDAVVFAKKAYNDTPKVDVDILLWGSDAADEEQRIGKLSALILLDGSVRRAIEFLHCELDTSIHDILVANKSKMHSDWHEGFMKISETYTPDQDDMKLF